MRNLGWFAAVLLGVPASAQEEDSYPTVTAGDPHALGNLFNFSPTDDRLKRWGSSAVKWRFDVHLPHGTKIDPEIYVGRQANILKLTNGRCFRVTTSEDVGPSSRAVVNEAVCPPKPTESKSAPQDLTRSGYKYRGAAFNLSAWTSTRSKITEFAKGSSLPVMATTMRVIAIDGGGSPDTPHTGVMIQGYAKGQLVLCLVTIITP